MADGTGPTRVDTWQINVRVENVRDPNRPMMDLGIWDKKDGGEVDSEEYKYSPGGMAQQVSLGGRKLVGNVTVSRLYRLLRDHATVHQMLISGAGRARMILATQPLDIDGNAGTSRPIVYNGTLKRCTPPTIDSESSDPAMIELEMTIEGEPTIG
jgi:hypothetical protein